MGVSANNEIKRLFAEEGIRGQYTAPHTPEQNGVAERKNRTLMEAARCMLIDASMAKRYWAEAVSTANFLQNILPNREIEKTPYELWNKQTADVDRLRIFGSKGYTHVPKEKRRKLDDKATLLTFVGYSMESKAYRMLDIKTNQITISRNVKFDENYSKSTKWEAEHDVQQKRKNETVEREKTVTRDKATRLAEVEFNLENLEEKQVVIDEADLERKNKEKDDDECEIIEFEELNETEPTFEDATDATFEYRGSTNKTSNMATRHSERTTKGQPPERFKHSARTAKNEIEEYKKPRNRSEALNRSEHREWTQAMDEELQSHMKNETWKLTELPQGRKAIGCKWVFKRKPNTETGTLKFKARLVAQRFSQKYGTDYDEVFALVVRADTLRLLLTVAAKK
ncbi:gag-pol polyprotein [Lasius niger]|uniref:Gag-pol polyprotein n=1 Tax=Lasius niger TaxID=67767 RepID=A0A0J7K6R8_LASNI|nr:gag-pol polyprotein [Lasius niger]